MIFAAWIDPASGQAKHQSAFQLGWEWDSNVYKTFGQERADLLTRARFQYQTKIHWSERVANTWEYQIGAKKFVAESAQDQLIQLLRVPFVLGSRKNKWVVIPSFKIQNESNEIDADGLDINEDYWTPAIDILVPFRISEKMSLHSAVSGRYFHFSSNTRFRYFNVHSLASLNYALTPDLTVSAGLSYGNVQFTAQGRGDDNWEYFSRLRFSVGPVITLGYAYETTNSSLEQFSFDTQKLSLQTSFDLGKRKKWPSLPVLSVHFMTTIQITDFSPTFAFDAEGQRFLLTDSEDESFNSMIAKISYHSTPWYSIEAKFTRFSNALSSQPRDFERMMGYLGVKIDL